MYKTFYASTFNDLPVSVIIFLKNHNTRIYYFSITEHNNKMQKPANPLSRTPSIQTESCTFATQDHPLHLYEPTK